MPHPIALDCGSGGTRIWRCVNGAMQRQPWPGGGRAPVLSSCLSSPDRREEFAAGVLALGEPCFIGATAGLRHALEQGAVTEADVAALRGLLPGSELRVLTPLEEAEYELRALRKCYPTDAMCAMISMGGKSMQCGREGHLFSVPFAMHLGYGLFQASLAKGPSRGGQPWSQLVTEVADVYKTRCAEAVERQGLQPITGTLMGVTDLVDMARPLGMLNCPPMSVESLLERLGTCVQGYTDRAHGSEGLERGELVLLARALALSAVAAQLFDPSGLLLSQQGSTQLGRMIFQSGKGIIALLLSQLSGAD